MNQEMIALFLAINKVYKPVEFWDVGANIGYYSWLLMSHNEHMRTVMFEPDPENISLLEKTISHARLNNVELVCKAVSDEVGKFDFNIDRVTGATGTLEISAQPFPQKYYGATTKNIKVETTTLDEEWKKRGGGG